MIRRKLSTLDVLSVNKDTPRVVWFLLDDAIYVEEKVISGKPVSTWEHDVITMVRKGHFKRECPQLNTEQPQRHRQQSQSHQQSITVNRPGRSTQSGTNSNKGRPERKMKGIKEGFSI
jgi:hypothetical protein